MAIPASGTVKLSDLQTEFGGSNPISLSEYYSVAVGVPASGVIQLAADFYGTSSSYTVNIVDDTNVQSGGDGASQTVSINFKADGTIVTTANINGYTSTTWIDEAPVTGVGSNYEIRVTNKTVGSYPPAWAADTWYSLSAGKAFTLTAITPGSFKECTCDFEIRDTATSTTQDTANISLYTARGT